MPGGQLTGGYDPHCFVLEGQSIQSIAYSNPRIPGCMFGADEDPIIAPLTKSQKPVPGVDEGLYSMFSTGRWGIKQQNRSQFVHSDTEGASFSFPSSPSVLAENHQTTFSSCVVDDENDGPPLLALLDSGYHYDSSLHLYSDSNCPGVLVSGHDSESQVTGSPLQRHLYNRFETDVKHNEMNPSRNNILFPSVDVWMNLNPSPQEGPVLFNIFEALEPASPQETEYPCFHGSPPPFDTFSNRDLGEPSYLNGRPASSCTERLVHNTSVAKHPRAHSAPRYVSEDLKAMDGFTLPSSRPSQHREAVLQFVRQHSGAGQIPSAVDHSMHSSPHPPWMSPPKKRKPGQRTKPHPACLFCKRRKIECKIPAPGSEDMTCNQCHKRSSKCEYPPESRRGKRGKAKCKQLSSTQVDAASLEWP